MSTKKYLSRNEKKKKKKDQEFILSQAGDLDKFVTRNISSTIENEECVNLVVDKEEQHKLGDTKNRNKQEHKNVDT